MHQQMIIFYPTVAEAIGVTGAIIVYEIDRAIRCSEPGESIVTYDNYLWLRRPLSGWRKYLLHLSDSSVIKGLNQLEQKDVIKVARFPGGSSERTKLFRVNQPVLEDFVKKIS